METPLALPMSNGMKWWKATLVIFGAVIIIALGIDAADTLTGSQGTLLSQVISTSDRQCPNGMVAVQNMPSVTCVDMYEASAGEKCPDLQPQQLVASIRNVEFSDCTTESKAGTFPWSFITRDQAMQMCARSGKRLPTANEWYAMSLGMSGVEQSCNVSSSELASSVPTLRVFHRKVSMIWWVMSGSG